MKNILFVLLIIQFSCVSYKRCKEKFSTIVDSVKIEIPVEVRVPKDSISIRYITDTLKHTIIKEQGRAKVFIYKDSIFTEVRVICKDSIIYLTKTIQVPVSQKYENEKIPWWIWLVLSMAGIVVIFAIFKR